MHVLITCKFKKDWINSDKEKEETLIFSRSRAANSAVCDQILTKFNLIQTFMHVLITCKYHKDRIINSREIVETSFFLLYKAYGDFFTSSRVANSAVGCRIWPNFELVRDLMHVLLTCKYKRMDEKLSRKSGDTIIPTIRLWG